MSDSVWLLVCVCASSLGFMAGILWAEDRLREERDETAEALKKLRGRE